jgi:glycosyltransferase involved in cell wall biosynthesis
LPLVLGRIPAWVDDVVIVDGGSRDATIEVALAAYPTARIFSQTSEGKGGALLEGFGHANTDIIVTLDADGSTDPAEIPRFLAALRTGADFAKGTRFIAGGGSADLTYIRRFGNAGLTFLVNRTFGTRFSDLCYGYNAFWRRCLPDLAIDLTGFEIETLLTLRAVRTGIRIVEVPSYESARFSGNRRINTARDGVRVLRTICSERLRPR